MTAILEISDVSASYDDGAPVLKSVSLRLEARQVLAVLGANGAGKSTLLRVLSGLLPARNGRIVFEGRDISVLPPHRRVELGLIQVPEGRQMLASMSVEENLMLGGYIHRRDSATLARSLDETFSIFPVLKERRRQLAGSLSGGQQQMVALGRAFMAKPRLLMCDEPSLGLAPLVVREIFEVLTRLRETGIPILLVEQNAKKAIELADRGVVLRGGAVILTGDAAVLNSSDEVKAAYLGGNSR
jgi:branched-chain amino acid transport system ATP-binding protein